MPAKTGTKVTKGKQIVVKKEEFKKGRKR